MGCGSAICHDGVDDVAGLRYPRLAEPVEDGRPLTPDAHDACVTQDRQVLAGVGHAHLYLPCEVAHGPLSRPENVDQHEALRIDQDLAKFGVEPVGLLIPSQSASSPAFRDRSVHREGSNYCVIAQLDINEPVPRCDLEGPRLQLPV